MLKLSLGLREQAKDVFGQSLVKQLATHQGCKRLVEKCDLALRGHSDCSTTLINQLTQQFSRLLVRLIDHESLFVYFLERGKDKCESSKYGH